MDKTNPSEAAAASSPDRLQVSDLPAEHALQAIAQNSNGHFPSTMQAMAREILRMRRDCPPTAEVEKLRADLAEAQQALGLMTTAKPDMLVDTSDPIGMAQKVVAEVEKLRESARSANLLRLQLSKVEGERDDLRVIAERNVGEMAKMASERVELQREVDRLREAREPVAAGDGPWSEATPERLDQAARALSYNSGQAEGAAKHILFVAGHRIESLLRRLASLAFERDAWKYKADTLGADLNRIRSLVPTASDEQTTFGAVQAELQRLRAEASSQALAMQGVEELVERLETAMEKGASRRKSLLAFIDKFFGEPNSEPVPGGAEKQASNFIADSAKQCILDYIGTLSPKHVLDALDWLAEEARSKVDTATASAIANASGRTKLGSHWRGGDGVGEGSGRPTCAHPKFGNVEPRFVSTCKPDFSKEPNFGGLGPDRCQDGLATTSVEGSPEPKMVRCGELGTSIGGFAGWVTPMGDGKQTVALVDREGREVQATEPEAKPADVLGEAFRQQMRVAAPDSLNAVDVRLRHLHAAVAELAKVVERIGAR